MDSSSGLLNDLENNCEIINDGEDVVVTRRDPGVFRRGRHIPAVTFEEFIARCSIQPASGREVLQVPENDRQKRILSIHTAFKMKTNDIMTRDGEDFEIQIVEDWGSYTKSTGVLKDV